MNRSSKGARCAAAAATLAVVVGLAASCSSDSEGSATGESTSAAATTTTESASTTSSVNKLAPATTTAAPAGPNYTIADYIVDEGIVETPIYMGDPDAPQIVLPFPEGWEDADEQTPDWAYGAIIYTGPESADYTPSMIAIVSKLEGNVDPQLLIDYAAGEVQNLPDFAPMGEGTTSTLAGFPAYQISGTYTSDDGTELVSAQKTAVIPAADGLYIMQINVDGTPDQIDLLASATQVVDDETTITP